MELPKWKLVKFQTSWQCSPSSPFSASPYIYRHHHHHHHLHHHHHHLYHHHQHLQQTYGKREDDGGILLCTYAVQCLPMYQNIRIYIISGIYKAYSKNLDSRYTRDIQGICQDISGIYNWHILGHTGDIYHVQDPSGSSGDWIGCIKVFRKYQLKSRIKTNSCTKISTTGERKTKPRFPDSFWS